MFSVPLTLATVAVVFVIDVDVADAARQTTLVPLAHDDVAHSMSATVPVGVRSVPAKLSPLSVTDSPPDAGMLLSPTRAQLATGASNVNTALPVPDTLATVIAVMLSLLQDVDAMHCTVVPLTHADVAQSTSPTVAVGVKSSDAKASPLSVTVSPPLCCMLELPMSAELATGAANTTERKEHGNKAQPCRKAVLAHVLDLGKVGKQRAIAIGNTEHGPVIKPSKERNEFTVPLTLATVIVVFVTDVAVAEAIRHTTLVALAQDDVAQSMSDTVPVGVRSAGAKASPLSVTDSPPDDGTLLWPTRAQLTAGAAADSG